MLCTCLTAEVASIRVNCQIYVTPVMFNTFITFLLQQSTLPAAIFLFVALVGRLFVHIMFACCGDRWI